jgi:hypothetical protein
VKIFPNASELADDLRAPEGAWLAKHTDRYCLLGPGANLQGAPIENGPGLMSKFIRLPRDNVDVSGFRERAGHFLQRISLQRIVGIEPVKNIAPAPGQSEVDGMTLPVIPFAPPTDARVS